METQQHISLLLHHLLLLHDDCHLDFELGLEGLDTHSQKSVPYYMYYTQLLNRGLLRNNCLDLVLEALDVLVCLGYLSCG